MNKYVEMNSPLTTHELIPLKIIYLIIIYLYIYLYIYSYFSHFLIFNYILIRKV